jgi:signal peptide peptidase SppA
MKYSRIVAEFYRRVWAIREETLISMRDLIHQQSAGMKWSVEEIRERVDASNLASGYVEHESVEPRYLCFDHQDQDRYLLQPMLVGGNSRSAAKGFGKAAPGSVAVIPMTGIISHRMSMMSEISGGGGGSTQALTAQFRQALQDPNCKAIVFDVDSPGGSVEGVTELASEIYDARKVKPIIAVANAMACSAAYWLASAASEVVCTNSGNCGSIGVYLLLQDESKALEDEGVKITMLKAGKYKAEGHPSQPLTDEARDFLQGQVDSVYSMFVKAVAQQRGVSQGSVREGMGQGRSLLATDAVKAGLADRVGTFDAEVARLLRRPAGRRALEDDGAEASKAPWLLSLARRRRQFALSAADVPDYRQALARPWSLSLARRRRQLALSDAAAGTILRFPSEVLAIGADVPDYKLALARRRRELLLIAGAERLYPSLGSSGE